MPLAIILKHTQAEPLVMSAFSSDIQVSFRLSFSSVIVICDASFACVFWVIQRDAQISCVMTECGELDVDPLHCSSQAWAHDVTPVPDGLQGESSSWRWSVTGTVTVTFNQNIWATWTLFVSMAVIKGFIQFTISGVLVFLLSDETLWP